MQHIRTIGATLCAGLAVLAAAMPAGAAASTHPIVAARIAGVHGVAIATAHPCSRGNA